MTKSFFFFRLIIVSFVQETRTRAGRRRGARAPEGDRDADRTSNDGETVDRIPPGLEEQPSPGKARLREGNPGGPEGISPGPEAGAIINNLPPGGNPPPQPPRNNPQAVPIPPRQPQPGCIDAAAIAANLVANVQNQQAQQRVQMEMALMRLGTSTCTEVFKEEQESSSHSSHKSQSI
jgi:hypothetical protein